MTKSKEKIFVILAGIGVVIALSYSLESDSYLGLVFESFSEPNWDEIHPLYVVENSIPVTLMESINGNCVVSANNFDIIIDHKYFKRGEELAQNLKYDRENETIHLPCDSLKGEKSQLNIWYVTDESPNHANKFQYFVSVWDIAKKEN